MMEFLRVDVFNTFALLTIPLLLLRNLPQTKQRFVKWDDIICKFIVFCGLLYTVCILIYWSYVLLFLGADKEEYAITNRVTGPYAWAYWLMAFSWLGLTIPLVVKRFRRNIVFRLLLIPFYLFTFEQIVILTISYHRDYLSSNWNPEIPTAFLDALLQIPYWPLHLLVKSALFLFYVFVFGWIQQKFKNLNASKLVSSNLE